MKLKVLKEIGMMHRGEIYSYLEWMSDKILKVVDEPDAKHKIFELIKEIYEEAEGSKY
jgi:hypothetical protein